MSQTKAPQIESATAIALSHLLPFVCVCRVTNCALEVVVLSLLDAELEGLGVVDDARLVVEGGLLHARRKGEPVQIISDFIDCMTALSIKLVNGQDHLPYEYEGFFFPYA